MVRFMTVKELGADEAVDYTTQKFEEIYKDAPFDCVVDLIGGGRSLITGKMGCAPSAGACGDIPAPSCRCVCSVSRRSWTCALGMQVTQSCGASKS